MQFANAATLSSLAETGVVSRSATLTGGTRTWSPSTNLYSGFIRPLLTRTSPCG